MKKKLMATLLAITLTLGMSITAYATETNWTVNVTATQVVQPHYNVKITNKNVMMSKNTSPETMAAGQEEWIGTYQVGAIMTAGELDSNDYIYIQPAVTSFTMTNTTNASDTKQATISQPKQKWRNTASNNDEVVIHSGDTDSGDYNLQTGTITVLLAENTTATYTGQFVINFGNAVD